MDNAKIETAIERLKAYEPAEGYHLAYSGGKDSVVLKALADKAGVKYKAVYRLTSVDPPELVQFIKSQSDVIVEKPMDKSGKQITMWNLILKKGPPTRLHRFCCEHFKETSGKGEIFLTGVRWDESVARARDRSVAEISTPAKITRKVVEENSGWREAERFTTLCRNEVGGG